MAPRERREPIADPTSETPILRLPASMTEDSVAVSSLDPEALILVRIAALVAVDAPAVSYVLKLGAAADVNIDAERIRGVLEVGLGNFPGGPTFPRDAQADRRRPPSAQLGYFDWGDVRAASGRGGCLYVRRARPGLHGGAEPHLVDPDGWGGVRHPAQAAKVPAPPWGLPGQHLLGPRHRL